MTSFLTTTVHTARYANLRQAVNMAKQAIEQAHATHTCLLVFARNYLDCDRHDLHALQECERALLTLAGFTRNKKIVVVLGCVLRIDEQTMDCSAVLSEGKIVGIVPQRAVSTTEIWLNNKAIAFSTDLVFRDKDKAFCICMDDCAALAPIVIQLGHKTDICGIEPALLQAKMLPHHAYVFAAEHGACISECGQILSADHMPTADIDCEYLLCNRLNALPVQPFTGVKICLPCHLKPQSRIYSCTPYALKPAHAKNLLSLLWHQISCACLQNNTAALSLCCEAHHSLLIACALAQHKRQAHEQFGCAQIDCSPEHLAYFRLLGLNVHLAHAQHAYKIHAVYLCDHAPSLLCGQPIPPTMALSCAKTLLPYNIYTQLLDELAPPDVLKQDFVAFHQAHFASPQKINMLKELTFR